MCGVRRTLREAFPWLRKTNNFRLGVLAARTPIWRMMHTPAYGASCIHASIVSLGSFDHERNVLFKAFVPFYVDLSSRPLRYTVHVRVQIAHACANSYASYSA